MRSCRALLAGLAALLLAAPGAALAQCSGVPGANLVCASPASGSGFPNFRALVLGDLPSGIQPTGAAGGSLAGTYPNPTIAAGVINNAALATGTFSAITGLGTVTAGTLNGLTVTGLPAPSQASDAATKGYVDAIASSLVVHTPVALATAAALPTVTYGNGSSGVGATLTATGNGALTVDGSAVTNGQRVLVKNQASGLQNGVYTQTTLGDGSTPFVLTRATDMDTVGSGASRMETGAYFFVSSGSANASSSYVLTTPATITIGTTALTFTQFASAPTYTTDSTLTLVGSTFGLAVPVLVPSGGTGVTTVAANGVLYGNGAGALQATAQGGANTVLAANGGAPSFTSAPTVTQITVPTVIGGAGATSTLTLQSTGGAGTTDAIIFKTAPGGSGTEQMRIVSGGNVGVRGAAPTSYLHIFGSLATAIAGVSTDVTLDATRHTVLCDASGASRTISLPSPNSAVGRVYVVKKVDSTANPCSVAGTIDGGSSLTLSIQYTFVRVQSDGNQWWSM